MAECAASGDHGGNVPLTGPGLWISGTTHMKKGGTMRTEQEIRQALEELKRRDTNPSILSGGKTGLSDYPVSHTIRGTVVAVLRWVLREEDSPW